MAHHHSPLNHAPLFQQDYFASAALPPPPPAGPLTALPVLADGDCQFSSVAAALNCEAYLPPGAAARVRAVFGPGAVGKLTGPILRAAVYCLFLADGHPEALALLDRWVTSGDNAGVKRFLAGRPAAALKPHDLAALYHTVLLDKATWGDEVTLMLLERLLGVCALVVQGAGHVPVMREPPVEKPLAFIALRLRFNHYDPLSDTETGRLVWGGHEDVPGPLWAAAKQVGAVLPPGWPAAQPDLPPPMAAWWDAASAAAAAAAASTAAGPAAAAMETVSVSYPLPTDAPSRPPDVMLDADGGLVEPDANVDMVLMLQCSMYAEDRFEYSGGGAGGGGGPPPPAGVSWHTLPALPHVAPMVLGNPFGKRPRY